ncbi:MAG: hypothetical protein WBP12_02105 [Candidatus Saccharimonas sp.]
MNILTAFSIVLLAALIHTSFQLGVSMVTLLSSHTGGKRLGDKHSLRLVGAFLGGTTVMTALLISSVSYISSALFGNHVPSFIWEFTAGALVVTGIAVWIFYYRRGDGTSLWLPRPLARLLNERIQSTTLSAEAFSLGLTGVIAEIIFLAVPVIAASLAIVTLPAIWQLPAVIAYVVIASLGMIIMSVLIGSGRKLTHIQEWRESNKRFLQFIAGCGLLVLSGYIYVNEVVATVAIAGGN